MKGKHFLLAVILICSTVSIHAQKCKKKDEFIQKRDAIVSIFRKYVQEQKWAEAALVIMDLQLLEGDNLKAYWNIGRGDCLKCYNCKKGLTGKRYTVEGPFLKEVHTYECLGKDTNYVVIPGKESARTSSKLESALKILVSTSHQ